MEVNVESLTTTTAETAGILSGKVWNSMYGLKKVICDGKTTQPRTRQALVGLCQIGGESR